MFAHILDMSRDDFDDRIISCYVRFKGRGNSTPEWVDVSHVYENTFEYRNLKAELEKTNKRKASEQGGRKLKKLKL